MPKTLKEWKYGAGQGRTSPALTQQFTMGELQQSELVWQGKILRVMGGRHWRQNSSIVCSGTKAKCHPLGLLLQPSIHYWIQSLDGGDSLTSFDHLFQWLIAFIFTESCFLFFKSILQIFFLWIDPNHQATLQMHRQFLLLFSKCISHVYCKYHMHTTKS